MSLWAHSAGQARCSPGGQLLRRAFFGIHPNRLRMDEHGTARRSGVQSVGVGAALLRALADANGPEPLGVLARAAEMSPAKAHRYLLSFVQAGLVVQSERTGNYDLGPLATRLGLAAIERFDVVRVATERLTDLRDAVDATTYFALWTDLGPTVVRFALSAHPITLAVRIGAATFSPPPQSWSWSSPIQTTRHGGSLVSLARSWSR